MKHCMVISRFLMLMIAFMCSAPSYASVSFWSDVKNTQPVSAASRQIIPGKYRLLKLQLEDVKRMLQTAPSEFSSEAASPVIIELPTPDGKTNSFYVFRSVIMEKPLADRFPGIQTFSCRAIDDPYATARIDYTLRGFHAAVFTSKGSYFIDPYTTTSDVLYMSYYASDYPADQQFMEPWSDGINGNGNDKEALYKAPDTQKNKATVLQQTSNGSVLRTFRIAIAATGGYTAYHGGTVALALSAQVTVLNRIIALFRKEFAISFVLVANNTDIIFTDDLTDPFLIPSPGESNRAIDSIIGTANYDIGHLFFCSGAGSGQAAVRSVCGSSKGAGVTGAAVPVGWKFEGVLAHELGHQFGARHTYNGCAGAASDPGYAYEPGSGSTIMSYAGGCGAESNIQAEKDPYYHSSSFNEVISFLSTIPCGVTTSTGNTPPVATVSATGYIIPFGTPFTLSGAGFDADGDSLTYCWEQYDLGTASYPTAPGVPGPRFRSYAPKNIPVRIIPDYDQLLAGVTPMGEVLSTGQQSLRFRLTVRDNRPTGGGVTFDSNFCTVTVADAGPFSVKDPLFWRAGSTDTVKWNVNKTNLAPVNCNQVTLSLSVDGGKTFPYILAAQTPNDGAQAVWVPAGLSTQTARIKIEASGNIFFNLSKSFTIDTKSIPLPVITSFTPQTGTSGTPVAIAGSGFSYITDVSFGGIPAGSFTVNSATSITAVAGTGTSGAITVTNNSGTATRSGFVFIPPAPPVITAFTPTSGSPTSAVDINGSNFLYISDVTFGGTPAAFFTVNSPTSITAIVGTGASGAVTVTGLWGTGSKEGFVMPQPYAGRYDTVGSGSVVNGTNSVPSPYGNYFEATKHQMIYTAAELTAAGIRPGIITEFGFHVSRLVPGALKNYSLKMGHTQLATLPSKMVTSGMAEVFSDTAYRARVGWNQHQLAKPFLWDGLSNLLVESCFNTFNLGTKNNTGTVYTAGLPSGIATYYRVNNKATACTDTFSAIAMTSRPNAKFFVVATPVIASRNIRFPSIGSTSVSVSWNKGDGGNRLVICSPVTSPVFNPLNLVDYPSDGVFGKGGTTGTDNYVVYKGADTAAVISGLLPQTTYRIRIIEYNGLPGNNNYHTAAMGDSNVRTLGSSGIGRLNGNSEEPVTIRPNPASGYITIVCKATSKEPAEILVTDQCGMVSLQGVAVQEETGMNISELSPGVYIISIRGGERTYFRKLMVR